MVIYNCIVNEPAAFEWFWGDFLQLYLKYKKMHNGMAAQNLQLYRKYKKAPALNKRYVLWGKTQRFRTYVSQHFWVSLIDRKQRFIYNRCDSLGC